LIIIDLGSRYMNAYSPFYWGKNIGGDYAS